VALARTTTVLFSLCGKGYNQLLCRRRGREKGRKDFDQGWRAQDACSNCMFQLLQGKVEVQLQRKW